MKTIEEVENLLETYELEEVLEFASVSRAAVLFFLFNDTDILDDFPEDLWPL